VSQATETRITFVSAGAGSGKTHRLTEILHRELSEKRVRPSGVIATTFTKKAATELRVRVRGHLLKQGDFLLANAMGQARIGTVNSVCGQLIERFAFEAGMAVDLQVIEEVQAAVLLDKAIDAVLDGPSMRELLAIVRRLGLIEDWKAELQKLVNQIRTNDIDPGRIADFAAANAGDLLAHLPKPCKNDLTAELRQAISAALPEIERGAVAKGQKNTASYLAQLRAFDRALANQSAAWGDWVKLSKSFPEAGLKSWAEPVAVLAARVAEHPGLRADIARYLEQMFGLAARALAIYSEHKRELGVLDFTDQEHQLLKLLDIPGVADVLDEELDLLMVDEFQDTSPIQLALFLKLARHARQVFWVGDIKQAIYGFRGSDTDLMLAILGELPRLGGSKEVLPNSWRSRRELVQLVNAVFSHAFANSLPKEEVELGPTRKDVLPGASVANWMLGGKKAEEEWAALAGGIRRLVGMHYQIHDKKEGTIRGVRFGDIAILSRSNDGVTAIARTLRAQGIPAAIAQPGLLSTPEATLALACLRRMNDSGDTIATAEIVSLADCLEPEEWVADRLRWLRDAGEPDAWLESDAAGRQAHPLLARIVGLRTGLPLLAPREALQAVITACDLPLIVMRWSKDAGAGRVRLANLEALLDLASQYEDLCRGGQHAASISGLVIWLNEIAAEEKDMLAEPAIDAVKVMTHHAAKGLEWPVVVLTGLHSDIKDRLWSISARPGTEFDVQFPLKDRFIRYWPWPFGAQKKVALADEIALTPLADKFRMAAIEEEKRLLYVSMTRARDLLVLARSSRKPTGEWIDSVDSPWLLPKEDGDPIELPSGEKIPAMKWALDPEEVSSATAESAQLCWFAGAEGGQARLPLVFNPSAAETVAAKLLEKQLIGERIPVRVGTDMGALGNAVHACMAAAFCDPRQPLAAKEVERILSAYGVADCVLADNVLRQVTALLDWISRRWPNAVALAEYPVQCVLESGQVLNGRIDLLLDTGDGWVLIDHKSTQLAAEHWEQLASDYGAQLKAYGDAIRLATGRKVRESWLFLPVAGGAVRLEVVSTGE
jgi:ATP-dependent exoDNAse (exonuclease V) beta subunit